METVKPVTLQIDLKSQEHIEPINLAFRQLNSLLEWFHNGNEAFLNPQDVQIAVSSFHPDKRYDPNTRSLTKFNHLSGVWLKYEACDFEPSSFDFWSSLAIAKGTDVWSDWSPVDHRRSAVLITAQLALHEGSELRQTYLDQPDNTPEIWRRLYWFTRFYRAWQRIFIGLTPAQFRSLEKKARAARQWKANAWRYFLEKSSNPKATSVRTIATNFSKLNANKISAHEVQVFIGRKVKLMTGKQLRKNTVRRPSANN